MVEDVLSLAADPVVPSPLWRHESIGGLCPFQDDVWSLPFHECEKASVQSTSLILEDVTHDFNACGFEFGEAFTGNERVGVVVATDNFTDSFLNYKIGAGGSETLMRTGLEIDV